MAPRDERPPSRRRFAVLITVGTLLWIFSEAFFETSLANDDSLFATAMAVLSFLAAYGGASMALLGLYRLLRAVERHLGVDRDGRAPAPVVEQSSDPS